MDYLFQLHCDDGDVLYHARRTLGDFDLGCCTNCSCDTIYHADLSEELCRSEFMPFDLDELFERRSMRPTR